jgi:hypothetical protein
LVQHPNHHSSYGRADILSGRTTIIIHTISRQNN